MAKKSKKIKVNVTVPDTSRAKKQSGMPMTKHWIDVEEGVKKDKEVKEREVFDFSYQPSKNSSKK
jgi:Zn/Cd-binding protein ZinT